MTNINTSGLNFVLPGSSKDLDSCYYLKEARQGNLVGRTVGDYINNTTQFVEQPKFNEFDVRYVHGGELKSSQSVGHAGNLVCKKTTVYSSGAPKYISYQGLAPNGDYFINRIDAKTGEPLKLAFKDSNGKSVVKDLSGFVFDAVKKLK